MNSIKVGYNSGDIHQEIYYADDEAQKLIIKNIKIDFFDLRIFKALNDLQYIIETTKKTENGIECLLLKCNFFLELGEMEKAKMILFTEKCVAIILKKIFIKI